MGLSYQVQAAYSTGVNITYLQSVEQGIQLLEPFERSVCFGSVFMFKGIAQTLGCQCQDIDTSAIEWSGTDLWLLTV